MEVRFWVFTIVEPPTWVPRRAYLEVEVRRRPISVTGIASRANRLATVDHRTLLHTDRFEVRVACVADYLPFRIGVCHDHHEPVIRARVAREYYPSAIRCPDSRSNISQDVKALVSTRASIPHHPKAADIGIPACA